jgi:hypothetical protein
MESNQPTILVLIATLFSLFIDAMNEFLEFSKYHMYADDLQIYHSRQREMLFECIRGVNSDLSKVFEWSLANSLKLNPSKSMVLPIYRNYLLVLFRRFFLVTILSRMFLRQRIWALILLMILIGLIMLAQSALRSMEPSLGFCRSYATCCCTCDSLSISHSILIRLENLRWRSMLVSGMSIVEGLLAIFLMSPTRFWAVLC